MSSSDLNNIDNTTEPKLCSNGCGFFGTSATKGFCSKCYNDLIKSVTQPPPPLPNPFLTLKQTSNPTLTLKQPSNPFPSVDLSRNFLFRVPSSSPASDTKNNVAEIIDDETNNNKKKKKRCGKCNKKVGLTGFQCRCGNMFCGSHRYAEAHECSFDFKAKGRSEIANSNPLVKADKLNRL